MLIGLYMHDYFFECYEFDQFNQMLKNLIIRDFREKVLSSPYMKIAKEMVRNYAYLEDLSGVLD